MEVWLTNVIGFALLYWELDRGGPVARRRLPRDELPPADWRFSQDENADTVTEVAITSSAKAGWVPVFVDYLYLSTTNSSAFSPTDTMPLSSRAEMLMAVQATSALLITLRVFDVDIPGRNAPAGLCKNRYTVASGSSYVNTTGVELESRLQNS